MLRDRLLFGRRARVFTLQWHLTNACELHCSHCYDRSDRGRFDFGQALGVLADLRRFCDERKVAGRVSFSGGNPLLHPDFDRVWRAAAVAGFAADILGNPAPRERMERLVAVRPPLYFQVSLEGLRESNDAVRGAGHFDRTLAFLDLLRELGVRAHVMLTLTRANLDEAIPLGELLRDRGSVGRYTFNRLSQVGEGAALAIPTKEEYAAFLRRWLVAARTNPILGSKDGLFNVARHRSGRPLTGGCTGHGCGAAFNFVALLPDGEVHACRKLPSRLGDIRSESLSAIWAGPTARRWREGNRACRGCPLAKSCGGCPAVVHGSGGRALEDPDPHCFFGEGEVGAGADNFLPHGPIAAAGDRG